GLVGLGRRVLPWLGPPSVLGRDEDVDVSRSGRGDLRRVPVTPSARTALIGSSMPARASSEIAQSTMGSSWSPSLIDWVTSAARTIWLGFATTWTLKPCTVLRPVRVIIRVSGSVVFTLRLTRPSGSGRVGLR